MTLRILLDEDIPVQCRHELSGYTVKTVEFMGWKGKKDREILELAEGKFDILITSDRHIKHQQNLAHYKIGIIELHPAIDSLAGINNLMPEVRKAIPKVKPHQIIIVTESE